MTDSIPNGKNISLKFSLNSKPGIARAFSFRTRFARAKPRSFQGTFGGH